MSDTSDLRRLLARYVQLVDDRSVDGLVALFAPDARVESTSGIHQGEAKIREWLQGHFESQPPDRMELHQAVNALLNIAEDGQSALGRTDVLCFRSHENSPWELEVVTRHHDKFTKRSGEWLFADKAIEVKGGWARVATPVPNPVSIE
jgi:hypothetical protein